MAKAHSSAATKRFKKSTGCARHMVEFTTKRGKTISFAGRLGKGCGPRKKPTPPPVEFRRGMANAARACKGRSHSAFLKCVSGQFRQRVEGAIRRA